LQQLDDLEERARRAGVPTPVGDAARSSPLPAQDRETYGEIMPRLVDLIDRADASRSAGDIAEEAAELLGRIHRAERSLAPLEDPEGRARPAPSFDSLREEYRRLFDACVIEAKYQTKVDQHVDALKKSKPRYQKVGQALDIPWHFIGIIHALEAGFNFRTHLHNGDPLTRKTVQVPAGRPEVWNPPNDWESSADDALRIKKFNAQEDWSLERTLYRWELYNGFGYRGKQTSEGKPVYSPYLWSFSNQYLKGKYVRDGIWDSNYVSQQCGAVTMLMGLIQAGEVARP
jgi:lysozyme family protein